MSCFWGCAKKVCIAVEHFNARRVGDKDGDWLPSTSATFRCAKCGNVSTQLLYASGNLTVAQINGETT